MNITVVHNQKSGGAGKLQDLQNAFKKHGLDADFIAIQDTRAVHTIRAAAKKRGAVVVAAGGDGTVQLAAGLVRRYKATLGVVPLGTLNHFAKDAGLPLDIAGAVQLIKNGKTALVDTGDVNGHIFINNSSIGLYPQSLRTRKKYRHKVGNIPSAIMSIAKVLVRPRRYRITLHVDGKRITRRTPFVFIGNNAYTVQGNEFLNRSSLTEGRLAIYIIKAKHPWHVVRLFITALFTKKRRTPDLDIYYTDSCVIKNRHRQLPIAFDGEVESLATPLHYAIKPKSLRIITK
jgi:diacylglycerol kinase family enzyme